jgi:uncharacterized protein (DUF2235 family)
VKAAMDRKIVICFDGTSNEVKAHAVTNVFKIVELLDLSDPNAQVVYYGPGVGTMAAPSAWSGFARKLSQTGGLVWGHGMRQDIGEAYTYLMNTWKPGNKVYVFGFSRGAYTARAFCGMLKTIGLLRPGSENLVPYALRIYARRASDSDLRKPEGWDRMDRFAEGLSVRVEPDKVDFPVEYLGLFDTVKATSFVLRDIKWPYTRKLSNVAWVRHAVSIDEQRRPFAPYLLTFPQAAPPNMKEVWFAGIHSDIGGGFPDNPKLGDISMRWVLDGAIARGLKVIQSRYTEDYTLVDADASASISRMNWKGRLAQMRPIGRRRTIPINAVIHGSVKSRTAADEKYRSRVPAKPAWEDKDSWAGPPPE